MLMMIPWPVVLTNMLTSRTTGNSLSCRLTGKITGIFFILFTCLLHVLLLKSDWNPQFCKIVESPSLVSKMLNLSISNGKKISRRYYF